LHIITAPASDDNGLLAVPHRVVRHDLGVRRDVLRWQLWQLVWLRVNPAERLHFLHVVIQHFFTSTR